MLTAGVRGGGNRITGHGTGTCVSNSRSPAKTQAVLVRLNATDPNVGGRRGGQPPATNGVFPFVHGLLRPAGRSNADGY